MKEALTWETAPDILTVTEAAMLVRIPRGGMYAAVKAKLVPAVNFGERRTRIAKEALLQAFSAAGQMLAFTAAFSHVAGGIK